MQFETIRNEIRPADEAAYRACLARFDAVAKPLGSLGALETLLARIASMGGDPALTLEKKCVLVFCADNGITAQGVAQSDHAVTTAIARMLVGGNSCVCVMARSCHADVFPFDVGMCDTLGGMTCVKLLPGTNDCTLGPAMPREIAIRAIETGAECVKQRVREGYRLIATGEAGIGNTATASAMASVLLNVPVERVTGRGAGLSDEGLLRKRSAIARAIARNAPDPADPLDVLSKVGGLDIAAMVGAFLGAAHSRIPVVMDGVISSVAALTACRICPSARDYILPSHMSAEPAGALLCEALALAPVLHAGLRLGEGTGAVALFPLLDMTRDVYRDAATFSDIAVDAYSKPLC